MTKVIITVDTEADNQWERGIFTTENINYIPRFQSLCDRYSLKPTYLCTYEIVKNEKFDRILKSYQEEGTAEIGAHLHPWTNPPFEDHPLGDKDSHPYPSELSPEIFFRKMKALTDIIYLKTGLSPKSYRAGRWGLSVAHVSILLKLGYKVDCSITPFISWENYIGRKKGGPNFKSAPNKPYFLGFKDVCKEGKSKLLEVPVTILFTNPLISNKKFLLDQFVKYRKTLTYRILDKVFKLSPQWFRPYPYMTAGNLINVYRVALRQKLPAIEMVLHSSELMPGCSPSNQTLVSIEKLYAKLEKLFKFISKNNGQGVTLGEFAAKYSREQ